MTSAPDSATRSAPAGRAASPDACLYLSKNKPNEVVNENSKIIIE